MQFLNTKTQRHKAAKIYLPSCLNAAKRMSIRVGRTMDDGRWTMCRRLSSIVYRQKPERSYDSVYLASSRLCVKMDQHHKLLFICTGNYYRSRYAELCFNARGAALAAD